MKIFNYLLEKYDPKKHIATDRDISKKIKKTIIKYSENLSSINVSLESRIHQDLKLNLNQFMGIIEDLEDYYEVEFDKDFFNFNNKNLPRQNQPSKTETNLAS